ncbi:MAG: PEP-CTERM sorting domain-containing protein [Pirellulales bacterium]|nr:PEP-CTERM sorting domain-containing protein [Pirellulales bacterium]
MRRALLCLFAGVLALGMSPPVRAGMIFSQNFDAFTLGEFTSKTTGKGNSATTDGLWRLASSSDTTAGNRPKVVNTQSYSPSQSASITRPASGARGKLQGYTTVAGSPFATGIYQLEVWLREENAGGNVSSCTFDLALDGSTSDPGVSKIGTGWSAGDGASVLQVYDMAALAWVSTHKVIPTDGSWFGVRLVTDLDTRASSAYINYGLGGGWELGVSGVAAATAASVSGVNAVVFDPSFAFGSNGTSVNSGTTWIDNVSLEQIPEPSTLALLATGLFGLSAWVWKKRRQGLNFRQLACKEFAPCNCPTPRNEGRIDA